jgi:hypothetical protein
MQQLALDTQSFDWSRQYPVVKIDRAGIKHSTPEEMENSLAFHPELQDCLNCRVCD